MEQEEKRDIVALTGLPVSDELQDILERCDRGEYVSIEEINNTLEMITAATCVSHLTPTILLKDRKQIAVYFITKTLKSLKKEKISRKHHMAVGV